MLEASSRSLASETWILAIAPHNQVCLMHDIARQRYRRRVKVDASNLAATVDRHYQAFDFLLQDLDIICSMYEPRGPLTSSTSVESSRVGLQVWSVKELWIAAVILVQEDLTVGIIDGDGSIACSSS